MARKAQLVADPLYKRAERVMVGRIVEGSWEPGARLPNEFALAEEFGVSQGTIRKALMALEDRGLVERSPGRGTTVSRTTQEDALYAFFRMRLSSGQLAVPNPLSEAVGRRSATPEERAILQPASTEVMTLRRVRQHEGTPLALEEMSFPSVLTEGMEADLPLPNSLYPYLQDRFGIAIMSACESVAAILAGPEEAAALDVDPGTPLLRVRREARDLADRIVELRHSTYRTDTATYQVKLTRSSG